MDTEWIQRGYTTDTEKCHFRYTPIQEFNTF